MFAKAISGRSLSDFFNFGGSSSAPAATSSAPVAKEAPKETKKDEPKKDDKKAKKEEAPPKEEEEEVGMGDLFGWFTYLNLIILYSFYTKVMNYFWTVLDLKLIWNIKFCQSYTKILKLGCNHKYQIITDKKSIDALKLDDD